ncbi:MAG: hypothetical protein ACI9BK_003085 [Acidimicrobiales bacterium]|jgi:hypothetical protein
MIRRNGCRDGGLGHDRDSAVSSGGPKTRKGTLAYIELVKRLRILDSVPAWSRTYSHFKRHAGPDKPHLADP